MPMFNMRELSVNDRELFKLRSLRKAVKRGLDVARAHRPNTQLVVDYEVKLAEIDEQVKARTR